MTLCIAFYHHNTTVKATMPSVIPIAAPASASAAPASASAAMSLKKLQKLILGKPNLTFEEFFRILLKIADILNILKEHTINMMETDAEGNNILHSMLMQDRDTPLRIRFKSMVTVLNNFDFFALLCAGINHDMKTPTDLISLFKLDDVLAVELSLMSKRYPSWPVDPSSWIIYTTGQFPEKLSNLKPFVMIGGHTYYPLFDMHLRWSTLMEFVDERKTTVTQGVGFIREDLPKPSYRIRYICDRKARAQYVKDLEHFIKRDYFTQEDAATSLPVGDGEIDNMIFKDDYKCAKENII